MFRSIPKAIIALMLAAGATCAMGGDTRFGAQGIISSPMEDLKTLAGPGPGVGAGAFMDILIAPGQSLRPHIDFIQYPTQSFSGGGSTRWSSRTIGVDYHHFLNNGFYLNAGLCLRAYGAFHLDDFLFSGNQPHSDNLGATLGVGYVINAHLEASGTYTITTLNGSGQLASIDLGIAYLF